MPSLGYWNAPAPISWTKSGPGALSVVPSGNSDWGGLKCNGPYYVNLQTLGNAMSQNITTANGSTYVIKFSAASRPGEQDILCVQAPSSGVSSTFSPGNTGFTQYIYVFTATDVTTTVTFFNCGPAGTSSIFITGLTVSASGQGSEIDAGKLLDWMRINCGHSWVVSCESDFSNILVSCCGGAESLVCQIHMGCPVSHSHQTALLGILNLNSISYSAPVFQVPPTSLRAQTRA